MTTYSFIDESGETRLVGSISPAPGGGSQPGALCSRDVLITEQANNGHSYPITAVDTVAFTYTIGGDHVADFLPFDFLIVAGSTGNDGQQMVASATLVEGNTVVGINQTYTGGFPADATADGDIFPSNYRAEIPIAAGSIVQRVIAYGLGAWATSPSGLACSVFDVNGNYIEGFTPPGAVYDPTDPLLYGPHSASDANYITGDLDSDGTGPNEPGSYSTAVTEYYRNTSFAASQQFVRPGVLYDSDGIVYVTVTAWSAAPVVPTGIMRVKVEYFAPVTAIAATFA